MILAPVAIEKLHAVVPARFVTIDLAATMTGLSRKAIERKIEKGEWAEGLQYRKRDGRIYIDMAGYERWIVGA